MLRGISQENPKCIRHIEVYIYEQTIYISIVHLQFIEHLGSGQDLSASGRMFFVKI